MVLKRGLSRQKQVKQEAPLPQRDRATRYVRWHFVNCCTAVRKIKFKRRTLWNDLEGDL